ncbi:hypothetical protein [Chryseobacterium sp.]|uniref:hypothetical protein n=1 Tax=Chryseobacterium sp. TaxID=1871047 RepID=UPI0035B137E8
MITITNCTKRQKEDGSTFYVLEVQGGIEMGMSQTINPFYATYKKGFHHFNICQALIETQMQEDH